MYLFGHVGLAISMLFLYERYSKNSKDIHKLIIGFGSMLPDFIDKPIGSLFFERGRWFGHSIIVLTLAYLIARYFAKDQETKTMVKIFYIGTLFHLLGDQPSLELVVLLWPFLGPVPITGRDSFLFGFSDPLYTAFELLGFFSICAIGLYEKWPPKYWLILVSTLIAYIAAFVVVYTILVGPIFVA